MGNLWSLWLLDCVGCGYAWGINRPPENINSSLAAKQLVCIVARKFDSLFWRELMFCFFLQRDIFLIEKYHCLPSFFSSQKNKFSWQGNLFWVAGQEKKNNPYRKKFVPRKEIYIYMVRRQRIIHIGENSFLEKKYAYIYIFFLIFFFPGENLSWVTG